MKQDTKLAVLVGIGVLVLLLGLILFSTRSNDSNDTTSTELPQQETEQQTESEAEVVTLEGFLDDYDDSCAADGPCYAYVKGYEILTNPGFTISPEIIGQNDVNSEFIGSEVEVKGELIGDKRISIVGSEDYYVRLKAN
jgi:hypothetical protein